MNYRETRDQLFSLSCPSCHGSGKCDDARPGELGYHQWSCLDCLGTGWKGGRVFSLTPSSSPSDSIQAFVDPHLNKI